MTVIELIKKLSKMPQTAKVWTEGCDCYGEVKDVIVQIEEKNKQQEILITRIN